VLARPEVIPREPDHVAVDPVHADEVHDGRHRALGLVQVGAVPALEEDAVGRRASDLEDGPADLDVDGINTADVATGVQRGEEVRVHGIAGAGDARAPVKALALAAHW